MSVTVIGLFAFFNFAALKRTFGLDFIKQNFFLVWILTIVGTISSIFVDFGLVEVLIDYFYANTLPLLHIFIWPIHLILLSGTLLEEVALILFMATIFRFVGFAIFTIWVEHAIYLFNQTKKYLKIIKQLFLI